MFKQSLLVLVAAGAIAIAAPFAAAQDSPSQNSDPQAPAQNNGHRHGMDPDQRTQELTRKLKLSSDQQAKVKDALVSEHSQMESLHQDSSLSQDDRHAKMMDIRKSTDTQIRGVLDSNQQKKWDEIEAQRGQWGQHHGQGGAPDQPAPPPQQ